MEIINGIYTEATLFLSENPDNNIDQYARSQISMLCDQEVLSGARIRVMPDVHPGKVGTIGFTATVGEGVMPLLLGIDIGCGMTVASINKGKKEWQKLDTVIRDRIPSGFSIRKTTHQVAESFDFSSLKCAGHLQIERCLRSLGTLGGGNHFIEVDKDDVSIDERNKSDKKDNSFYLIVHSGSHHLGKEITDYYMAEGQKRLKSIGESIPYELTWIDGQLARDYIHDVEAGTGLPLMDRGG